jgi:phytanoyl-CoA hydroxylase
VANNILTEGEIALLKKETAHIFRGGRGHVEGMIDFGEPGYIMKRIPNDNSEYADTDTIDISGFVKEEIIPVEVKSGSVVFFNGYTLPSSLQNKTTDCFRMALVNHYMRAESMLPWDQDGKLEPTEDLRDIILIRGSDPYKYKGTVDANKPYLRPTN